MAYREQQLERAQEAGRSPRYLAERRRLLERAVAWRDGARRAVDRRGDFDGSERSHRRSPAARARRYAKRIAQLEEHRRSAASEEHRAVLLDLIAGAERSLAVALHELGGQPAAQPTSGGQPVGTILSTAAVAVLAERHVREADEAVPVADLLDWLDRVGVPEDRAQAGVERATSNGRLEATVDADERHCVRVRRQEFAIAADLFDPSGARAAA